jgi:hypothetical protein
MRSAVIQVVALCVGFHASLAGTAVSLAHGHAHSEAAEHAAHHAGSPASMPEQPAIDAGDHEKDHAHPRLDPTGLTRVAKDVPAIHAETVTLAFGDVVCRDNRDAPKPDESPPERPSTSPLQSRAPPTL